MQFQGGCHKGLLRYLLEGAIKSQILFTLLLSYDARDKGELVFLSRAQHPFKTTSQTKSALAGQKRGF